MSVHVSWLRGKAELCEQIAEERLRRRDRIPRHPWRIGSRKQLAEDAAFWQGQALRYTALADEIEKRDAELETAE